MSRQHHHLKTVNPYFRDIESGKKTFEVRFNDRNYQVGDMLHLREFAPPDNFSGREIITEVVYMLDDPNYCKEGFVIMGIEIFDKNF